MPAAETRTAAQTILVSRPPPTKLLIAVLRRFAKPSWRYCLRMLIVVSWRRARAATCVECAARIALRGVAHVSYLEYIMRERWARNSRL